MIVSYPNIDSEYDRFFIKGVFDGDGCLTYWTYWPEEMIDSKFDGVDPFEDDHFADSWEEVVKKIEYVARDLSLPLP